MAAWSTGFKKWFLYFCGERKGGLCALDGETGGDDPRAGSGGSGGSNAHLWWSGNTCEALVMAAKGGGGVGGRGCGGKVAGENVTLARVCS